MKKSKSVPVEDLIAKFLGKSATLRIEVRGKLNIPFHIPVTILGVRKGYGRIEYRVKSALGIGEAWVSDSFVDL
jgi:hypothetical protein